MKKNLLIIALFIGFASSCSSDTDEFIREIISSDLNAVDLSKGLETTGGKHWSETFTPDTALKIEEFTFSHTGNVTYWNGFTLSNSTDNSNWKTGDEWVKNQWGCMAKKGSQGANYIVANWMSYGEGSVNEEFSENKFSNWIKVENGIINYSAISIDICNSPWVYHAITEGVAPARPFKDGDFFKLKIYGVGPDNVFKNVVVEYYLADYRDGKKELAKEWKRINLTKLGTIKYLVFQMETTDVGEWGANTPSYFCLDNLNVEVLK